MYGKYGEFLDKYLINAFNSIGLPVYVGASLEAPCDFKIMPDLTIEKINLDRDEKLVRWELVIVVEDMRTGSQDVTFISNCCEEHINEIETINREIQEFKKMLKLNFEITLWLIYN